jgi:hypothetical protein
VQTSRTGRCEDVGLLHDRHLRPAFSRFEATRHYRIVTTEM